MNRLKKIFLEMAQDTQTYTGMYEGEVLEVSPDGTTCLSSDNTYFSGETGFKIEHTNRLSPDRPTVVIQIPASGLGISEGSAAAADFCLRAFKPYIDSLNAELFNRKRPDRENGRYFLYSPGPEVLVRNSAYFAVCTAKDYTNGSGKTVYLKAVPESERTRSCLCIRIQVQLPYKKLRRAMKMLTGDLPSAVDAFMREFDAEGLNAALDLARKQRAVREFLKTGGYCAFIADGSILPRHKNSSLPMENALPFVSPPGDAVEVCGIRGMGIRRGVTVITGGGYSGKSTLLDAISAGIYDHVRGDGRELCITDDTAVTVSAEDGRSVKSVNISPFVKWIPGGDPRDFSTEHASGSTSQAANVVEAVNAGAGLLLMDEDKSAANFMICDPAMKKLIQKEPITPFTDRAAELHLRQGVSTILVIGGSSEYLSVADRVYMMDSFSLSDVTERSKKLCEDRPGAELPSPADWKHRRTLHAEGFTSFPEGQGSERLEVPDLGFIFIGDERIDVRALRDIATPAQVTALGFMLRRLEITNSSGQIDISSRIDELYGSISRDGLDTVYSGFFSGCGRFLDLPRRTELLAVINRMRRIRFSPQ